MPRPRNAREVRSFLTNRAERPRNEAPTVGVSGETATIRLYDSVDSWGGWWGLSAEELADAVDALPSEVSEIRLLINSPGGDVFDGLAMMNILRAHPARVVAVVQGLAASAASFIAVGADELVMNPGAMLMIHDASTGVYGWADDLREVADLLDKISDNIAGIYASKAGGTVTDWRDQMRSEAWYTADEAITAKLADSVGVNAGDAPAIDEDDIEPDPPAPEYLDAAARVFTVAQVRDFLATSGTDSKIDPDPGEDVDATGDGDPTGCLDLMSMRLALVTT